MRRQLRAYFQIRDNALAPALLSLAAADSLAPGERFAVFHGNNAAYRSLALFRLGRVDEAEAQARRAVDLDDSDPNAWLATASVRSARGDLDGALRALDEVLVRQPGNASVRLLRAQVEAQRGN
jgi:tetratricopeptide (TPR) repeat protein